MRSKLIYTRRLKTWNVNTSRRTRICVNHRVRELSFRRKKTTSDLDQNQTREISFEEEHTEGGRGRERVLEQSWAIVYFKVQFGF